MRLNDAYYGEFDIYIKYNRLDNGTVITFLKTTIGPGYITAAVCNPSDQFCKATGRLLAARRMNTALKEDGFSRHVRRMIFRAATPQFSKKVKA